MPDKKICMYLSTRGKYGDTVSREAEAVFEKLVLPAVEHFPNLESKGMAHDLVYAGSPFTPVADLMMAADLVIADLTGGTSEGYYQIGLRQSAQLPLVLIAEDGIELSVNLSGIEYVGYPFDRLPNTEAIDRLSNAIRQAFDTAQRGSTSSQIPLKSTPRERRFDLAERIEETAEIIAHFRINSAGEAVTELRAVAEELKVAKDENTFTALKEAADAVLKVLLKILDQLATVRGARMAISGAIALVVGGAGWPAVTALGLGLAFWEGKEAFLKALEKLGGKQANKPAKGP